VLTISIKIFMRNTWLVLTLCILVAPVLYAQKRASSAPASYSIKPKIEPPILSLADNSIRFSDANGNRAIDANESCYVEFTLKNDGFGDGLNLIAKTQTTGSAQGLRIENRVTLERVPRSGKMNYRIPITSDMNTVNGNISLSIQIEEPNGFNPPPFSIDIETREFRSPMVKVVDFSLSGDGVLKPMKQFDLKILIQNTGQGGGKDITASLKLPENVMLLDGEEVVRISQLQAGETRNLSFSVIINSKYTGSTVPISIDLKEHYGRYAESWKNSFTMNQQMAAPRKLVVEAQAQEKTNIETASLKSDIQRNIPRTQKRHPNRLALVIGNEDYASRRSGLSATVNVDYAQNDAMVYAQYLEQSFGLETSHIKLLTNATAGEMRGGLAWIENLTRATGPETEIYFYYSGHGLPSDMDKTPYLIPVDVSGDRPELGIALREVYDQLSKHPSKKITVVLDACFSGGARNEELVAKKGVRVKPKEDAIPENMVVLTSSSGSQSSAVYREKQHGYLTYFFLKAIQTHGVKARYETLFESARSEVDKETARQGMIQQPQILTPPALGNTWYNWTVE
jgi:hypothetical protein